MKKSIKILLIVLVALCGAGYLYFQLWGLIVFSPFGDKIIQLLGDYPGRGWRYDNGGGFVGCSPKMFPDDSKIVFSSPRSGRGDIYIMNYDGKNLVQLTKTSEYEGEPFISPDSKKIVYVSEIHGADEIYIMNTDGTNQTQLTSNNKNKCIDSNPSFISDGTTIMFTRYFKEEDYSELFTINIDGNGLKKLSNNQKIINYPTLFPDGKRILFQSDNFMIGVINLDGSDKKMFAANASNPRLSPDGKRIAFISDRETKFQYELYIMSTNGSYRKEFKKLTNLKGYLSDPSFTPDGSKIIFLYEPEGCPENGKGQIYMVNIDGSELKMVRNNF